MCKGRQITGCLNSLSWDKNIFLETKSRQEKLWLYQWLYMDVNYGFLKERERGIKKIISSRNGLFKEVS